MHAHTFESHTPFIEAKEAILTQITRHDRTEIVHVSGAQERVTSQPVSAARSVPHYARAAMDGFAVRAEDTFNAGSQSPVTLQETTTDVAQGEAKRVHTGSELPSGATAVIMIEHVNTHEGIIEVFDAVPTGENVAPVGEDVARDAQVFDRGHQLSPVDLGMLKSVGVDSLEVFEPPKIAVIPTGEELVETDPGPGEVVETNGLTVSRLVEQWGGDATYGDIVTDDESALSNAIRQALAADVIVTTGGSSVGERDLIPDLVSDLGEVVVHGVGIKPGHPFGFGIIDDTPSLMLPGYPVSCVITAVQFLRPVIKAIGGMPESSFPQVEAQLANKLRSEPGIRSFVRVTLDEQDDSTLASREMASGAGVLSSVTNADGWVVIPESLEGVEEGETVMVEDWEWQP